MRVGEQGKGWQTRRLKAMFDQLRNGVWGQEPGGDATDVVCVRVADFDRVQGIASTSAATVRSISRHQVEQHMLQHGDILLEKSGGGDLRPVGFAVIYLGQPRPAVCSNFVARGVASRAADPHFLNYLLRSLYDRRLNTRFIKQSTGIQNLDATGFLSLDVTVPALPQQKEIAEFLERETAHMDRLIEGKERLLALLQEKRSALITRAVTKGLDPEAPMRDSGLEWIGEVPCHWESVQIRRVARIESGHTPTRGVAEYWQGGEVPWVSLADTQQLRERDVITDTAHFITPEGLANSSARILPAGAVLFTRDASVGLAAVAGADLAVSQHLIAWVCGDRVHPRYLLHVVRAMSQELNRLTAGATLRTIGMDDVRSLSMPLPPVEEQGRIVSEIRTRLAGIDRVLEATTRSITLLRERRSALITAAVTGQIDVSEYEASHRAPLADLDEELEVGEPPAAAAAAD